MAEASQRRSNWQYSAGLSSGLGGRGARRRTVPGQRADTVFLDRASGRRLSAAQMRDTLMRDTLMRDTLVRDVAGGEVAPLAAGETVVERFVASLPFSALRRFGGGRVPELVVEHQGVSLFDVNRVIVGLGWRR